MYTILQNNILTLKHVNNKIIKNEVNIKREIISENARRFPLATCVNQTKAQSYPN